MAMKGFSVSLLWLCGLGVLSANATGGGEPRPHVLWFVVDDMSAQFSCYGESLVETPHVDRLAREGMRFSKAHVTAPVCSTCRSAFITGMYQWSLGLQHHRSGRDQAKIKLPKEVVPVPELFRRAGYYTCNGSGLPRSSGIKPRTKTDYNFEGHRDLYDGPDWSGREEGQPFFMQVQMAGGKLRGGQRESCQRLIKRARETFGNNVDARRVELPDYYPRDPVLIEDWTAYLEAVRLTDHHVGQVLKRLEEEGLYERTLILFMTDHGISHARGKQFLTYEGTHIPFVVRGPGITAGVVRDDPIEHIDMGAISLAFAGIKIPTWMQGQNVLSPDYQPRRAVFGGRDRCDETVEFIRSVRSQGYLYIRNYNPSRPHLQPSRYKDGKDILKQLRALHQDGALSPLQEQLLFSRIREGEELYDTRSDPYETRNLAGDPTVVAQLESMRQLLDNHLLKTRDAGFIPEPLLAEIAIDPRWTIHQFVHSEQHYPLKRILSIANQAILRRADQGEAFRLELDDENAVVRYWAAMGLRTLADRFPGALRDAETLAQDPDVSVRLVGGGLMGVLGDRDRAGALFVREARAAQTDAHALWALDGIKFLNQPQMIGTVQRDEVVRGEYSGRAFDFLAGQGLVYRTP